MHIEKDKVKKIFSDYVSNYDTKDPRIKFKINHTYRVSELCNKIALSLNLNDEDVSLAYLIGLLHDIGRFEQLRRYNTLIDSKSIDHADFGVEILFNDGRINDFTLDRSEDELIKQAVKYHNKYKIPKNLSKRCETFCNIIRDADKVDIFKVNTIVPLEDIYNLPKSEVYNAMMTERVVDSIRKHETVLRDYKKTPIDNLAGDISLVFGLVYDESIKITKEQGNLEKTLQFKSYNYVTNTQIKEIRGLVENYINERI